MLPDMAGDDPRPDVIGATSWIPNDEIDVLARVELFRSLCRGLTVQPGQQDNGRRTRNDTHVGFPL
jgi:hypothetical protein